MAVQSASNGIASVSAKDCVEGTAYTDTQPEVNWEEVRRGRFTTDPPEEVAWIIVEIVLRTDDPAGVEIEEAP